MCTLLKQALVVRGIALPAAQIRPHIHEAVP
jgi:hypothetical protein